MKCLRVNVSACSDPEPNWDLVAGETIEGPFCFQHALRDIERAERAGAIRVPEMRPRTEKKS